MIAIMTKSPKEAMSVEGESEGYVTHVKLGSIPACSNLQATDAAKAVGTGTVVTQINNNMSVILMIVKTTNITIGSILK